MRNVLRSAAVVAAGAVVTATLAAPATAAPADRGGEWLQGELTDGIIVNETFDPDFRDYGLTADVGMAFAEIRQAAPLAEVSDALAAEVDSYTTGADFGAPDDVYAGPVAKLTVVAQVAGDDPRAYGGVDLVQRLNGRVATTAPIAGRIEDRSDFGDFANTIGQAFAARGLARAGSGRADHVRPVPPEAAVLRRLLPARVLGQAEGRPVVRRGIGREPCSRHRRHRARGAGPAGAPQGRPDARDPDRGHRRRRLAEAPAEAERQLRRRGRHRGQQRQQHRAGCVGARGCRCLPSGSPGRGLGPRPAGPGRRHRTARG